MTDTLKENLAEWQVATTALPRGVKRVLYDVLDLTAAEKMNNLIYGSDYSGSGTCLINAAGPLLTTGGGKGVPVTHYRRVVYLYDAINRQLFDLNVNTKYGYVSPLAAEILLQHFADMADVPDVIIPENELVTADSPYVEPSDEEMYTNWLTAIASEAPSEASNASEASEPSENNDQSESASTRHW